MYARRALSGKRENEMFYPSYRFFHLHRHFQIHEHVRTGGDIIPADKTEEILLFPFCRALTEGENNYLSLVRNSYADITLGVIFYLVRDNFVTGN